MTAKELASLRELRDLRERRAARSLADARSGERQRESDAAQAARSEAGFGKQRLEEETTLTAAFKGKPQTIGQILASGETLRGLAERHQQLRVDVAKANSSVQMAAAAVTSAQTVHQAATRKAEGLNYLRQRAEKVAIGQKEASEELDGEELVSRIRHRPFT